MSERTGNNMDWIHPYRIRRILLYIFTSIMTFTILCIELKVEVMAQERTLVNYEQGQNGNSSVFYSDYKENIIYGIDKIDYLNVSYANTCHSKHCYDCGDVVKDTTTTVNIFGHVRNGGNEVKICGYSISGHDGTYNKKASNVVKFSDEDREKYDYLRITVSFSGSTVTNCDCDGIYKGFGNGGIGYVRVIANEFDGPSINAGGNLSDISTIEGVDCVIGPVSATFPSGGETYKWQYSEGGEWVNLTDGTKSYSTSSHGTIQLSDSAGGEQFSKSRSIRLLSPKSNMTGLKFRVVLGTGSLSTNSNECSLVVKKKDVVDFYSVRFAYRYGQIGEKLSMNDFMAYVKFNNGQVVDIEQIRGVDSGIKYYGMIKPVGDVTQKGMDEILAGLSDGSIESESIDEGSEELKIKNGNNIFYVKLSYSGDTLKNIYGAVTFEGMDEVPPEFSENVELYEADGTSLYLRGDYKISNESGEKLKIKGSISDTISEGNDVSWAYTFKGKNDSSSDISIPVYKMGSEIDVDVTKNGVYTLLAEDKSGNTASKIINVNAFDEHSPTLTVSVTGIKSEGSNYVRSYVISIDGEDAEGLSKKPYLFKVFGDEASANAYDVSSAPESEYVANSSKTVMAAGCYVIAVRDAAMKTAKKVVKIPKEGEIIDSTNPEIMISPSSIKDYSGDMAEYDINIFDGGAVKSLEITDQGGVKTAQINHDHKTECKDGSCSFTYHFVPVKEGTYKVSAVDEAGNLSSASFSVSSRSVTGIEITGIPDSQSVNAEIDVNKLISGSQILIKMSDGTSDTFHNQDNMKFECEDKDGNKIDKLIIGYGENTIIGKLTLYPGTAKERTVTFTKTITGEDNVAPLPGEFKTGYSEGWDGSLTNDLSKKVTLRAEGFEDDGSIKNNLEVVWYKDDVEVQRKKVGENGAEYGPFSGEEMNGVYRYTITDENGNFCNSTFQKTIECWDTTPPTGEVRILPEGSTSDSKARYKQLQIVNASDDHGLAKMPYSFLGNDESKYGIVASIVAGENATYEIYIKDSVGNVTHLGDFALTGIDSSAPVINGYEVKDGENGGQILHIDAVDTDAEGNNSASNLKYSIDGDNYQDSPDFEISKSGVYTIYVKDETGNITKTSTDYTDTDKPVISALQDENGGGAIIVSAQDNVGLSRVVMEGPDGIKEVLQVYDGATEDVIRKEIGKLGNYVVTATDMSGNSESAQVEITSIAAANTSSVLTGLKVTPSGWTGSDVTVIAQLSDTTGLSSSPFRWNGSIPTSMPYVVMTENGQASVEICDKYGNVIAKEEISVTNIDKISPVMEELSQSEDKNHLYVKASDVGSGIAQITISGGPYSVETGVVTLSGENNPDRMIITLPTNGTYTVRAYDRAGNSCQKQLNVTGVTTDVAKETVEAEGTTTVVTKEKVVTVDNVVTQDRIVTQNVEVPVPILVPIPTQEVITRYKVVKESGGDTSEIIRGGENGDGDGNGSPEMDTGDSGLSEEDKVTEAIDSEISNEQNLQRAIGGEYTDDGTYIAPDGFEYFGRVDPNLKKDHPLLYWFKKNAEKIAKAALAMCLVLLIICLCFGALLTKDYFKEQSEKRKLEHLKKK